MKSGKSVGLDGNTVELLEKNPDDTLIKWRSSQTGKCPA